MKRIKKEYQTKALRVPEILKQMLELISGVVHKLRRQIFGFF